MLGNLTVNTLSIKNYPQAIAFLCDADSDLRGIHAEFGPPPLWRRDPGFPTLVHLILEQQVSAASAEAALAKLYRAVSTLNPENFLRLSDAELRQIGFSRQKTAYCQGLARVILQHKLDLEELEGLDDAAVRSRLVQIKGIGNWTADNYLLMALMRPDILPLGDLALVAAMQKLKRLPSRPTAAQVEQIAAAWQPWRAVAARFLWYYYLSKPAEFRRQAERLGSKKSKQ